MFWWAFGKNKCWTFLLWNIWHLCAWTVSMFACTEFACTEWIHTTKTSSFTSAPSALVSDSIIFSVYLPLSMCTPPSLTCLSRRSLSGDPLVIKQHTLTLTFLILVFRHPTSSLSSWNAVDSSPTPASPRHGTGCALSTRTRCVVAQRCLWLCALPFEVGGFPHHSDGADDLATM